MLKPRQSQASFYRSYLYDRIIPQNHLGSTSVTTSAVGAIVATMKFFPFGAGRSSTGSLGTDKKFTGQRLDGTGLYFYGARMYDPDIGRFTSPDTFVSNFANAQSLNRYAYVLNNPLKHTDPTGNCVFGLPCPGLVKQALSLATDTGKVVAFAFIRGQDYAAQGLVGEAKGYAEPVYQVGAKLFVAQAQADAIMTAFIPEFSQVKEVIQVPQSSLTGLVLGASTASISGASAVTINQTVITTRDITNQDNVKTGLVSETIRHEAKHAEQQASGGFGWYWDYLTESSVNGYAGNKYEVEATQFASESTVTPTLTISNLASYYNDYDWLYYYYPW